MKTQSTATRPKRKGISYAKWGYLFILPFFITYCIFALVPQLLTIYNSFFENHTIYDQIINEDLQKTWREYCDGDVTEDAAMANFYALVSEAYPSVMTP